MATNSPMTASVVVNLTGNMTQRAAEFGRAISRMDTQASQSLAHLRQSIHTTSADLDSMGNMALTWGTASMTAAGYAFNQTFLTQAKLMESYRLRAQSLFGEEGAGQALEWAKQNAETTIYSLNDVMDAMVTLKSRGLDPTQVLPIMQDMGAMMGWTADEAKGAMRQFGQMWSKGRILEEDASILGDYGINVLEEISTATGIAREELIKMQTDGKLGREAIRLLFKQLQQHYAGGSKKAMEGLNGALSNLNDKWLDFQTRVMDAGVSDEIIKQAKSLIGMYDAAAKSGELDSIVQNAADLLKTVIEEGPKAAQSILEVGEAINTVAQALGGWETLAKGMAAIYAANKLARLGSGAVSAGKAAHGWGRAGWQGGRNAYDYLRGQRNEPDKPGVDLPGLDDVQRVFVVNWPSEAEGFGGNGGRSSRQQRKKGRGGVRPPLPTISQNAPARPVPSPKPESSTLPESPKPTTPRAPKKMPLTSVIAPGPLASVAGKATPVIGSALAVAEFAMADNNEQRGEAIGGGLGAALGAGIGTVLLPGLGTVMGAVLGDFLGSLAGGEVGSKLDEPAAANKGEIKVTLDVPEHVKVKSVQTTSPDYEMAFYRGSPWGGF